MNANEPTVTVVLPVFNAMPFLRDTLASIAAQTLTQGEIEIIAIDDGSTDGSGEHLDQFAAAHSNVQVIHQPNSGWPGMPRNRGLELARGRFIFFADGDDTLHPDALRQMVEMANNSGAEIVIPRMTGTGGRQVQRFFMTQRQGKLPVELALHTLSPQKLFLRSFIESLHLRFAEGLVRLEDGIFVTHAYLNAKRIDLCGEEPLYFILQRDDGENISARDIEPAGYVHSLSIICADIRAHITSARKADTLVLGIFQRKGLRFYQPDRWLLLSEAVRKQWVTAHQDFLQREVPSGAAKQLTQPGDKQLLQLIRNGDIDAINLHVMARAVNTHSSIATLGQRRGGSLELLINIHALPQTPLLIDVGLDATVQQALPNLNGGCQLVGLSTKRLRTAERITRFFSTVASLRVVRGVTRKLENWVVGATPRMFLVLTHRKTGQQVRLTARWAGVPHTPGTTAAYRFFLTSDFLQKLSKAQPLANTDPVTPSEVIDLHTLPRSGDGQFGRLARVRVDEGFTPVEWGNAHTYQTDAGNLSIRF